MKTINNQENAAKCQDFASTTVTNMQNQESKYSNTVQMEHHNTESVMVDMMNSELDLSSDWDGDM